MSEVFEGVISKAPVTAIKSYLEEAKPSLDTDIADMGKGLSVVYRNDPRSSSVFISDMCRLAQQISDRFSLSLLVRYDSRTGHRSSELYSNGNLCKSFGKKDELYVRLDENGEPLSDHSPLRASDFVTGEEYETIRNAIQLGLAELGGISWMDLKKLIGRL